MDDFELKKLLDFMWQKCKGYFVKGQYTDFMDIYPFTTENILGYINNFDLENESLLTVGSSGDQVINAALYGCTDITLIDFNPYTRFYFFLKMACLLELEKQEFVDFLSSNGFRALDPKNDKTFNKNVYSRIRDRLERLDVSSSIIWDKLFANFNQLKIRKELFSRDEYDKNVIIAINPYLATEDNYYEARAKIQEAKVKFLVGDLVKCGVEGTYDNIWLSNICQYLTFEEIKLLVDKIVHNLNADGKLMISYLYNIRSKTYRNLCPIYMLDKVFDLLKDYYIYPETFDGIEKVMDGVGRDDGILLYEKVKQ